MRARNSGSRFRERAYHREFISVVRRRRRADCARSPATMTTIGFSFIIRTLLTQSRDGNYRLPRVITISREKETMPARTRVRWINGNLNYTTHGVFD